VGKHYFWNRVFLLTSFLSCIFLLKHSQTVLAHHTSINEEIASSKSSEELDHSTVVQGESISIIFAGDTLFDWSVRDAINQYGTNFPFVYVKEEVQKADLAILNLETAVTFHTEKDTSQLYNFKSDPIALSGIKDAGFDLVTLANNHALDYQKAGLLDTFHYLEEHGLGYFGAGKNTDEAYQSVEVEIKGKKIKFLGFSRFVPAVHWYEGEGPVVASGYQEDRVYETIKREKKGTDYLIIYIHWGVERNNQPEEWQRNYAKNMIDSGADVIIGSHPHVLQGFEYYKGKPIAYSLGNFVFPDYVSGKTAETGLLTLTINDSELTMYFNPYFIKDNQILPLEGLEDELMYQYLQEISYNVNIEDGLITHVKNLHIIHGISML
jgi:hypothetical protein